MITRCVVALVGGLLVWFGLETAKDPAEFIFLLGVVLILRKQLWRRYQ